MSKNSSCKICAACGVLLFSIAGVVLLSRLLTSLGQEKVMVSSLAENLEAKGISNIIQMSSASCPSGTYPLFKNIFPGTTENCLCQNLRNGRYSFQKLNNRTCDVNGRFYKCKKLTLPQKTLEVYRGSRFCFTPSQFSYDSYEFSDNVQGCPSNTKVCGRDEKGFLCLRTNQSCPINLLKIVKGDGQSLASSIPGGRTLPMGGGYNLLYSNQNTNGKIVAETGWSFEGMCANPEEKLISRSEGLSMFADSKNWVERCQNVEGLQKDPRWENTDTYNWLQLLGENASVFRNLENSALLTPSSLNRPYRVYQRGYVHFSKKCKWDKNSSISNNLRQLSPTSGRRSIEPFVIGAITMFALAIAGSLCFFCISLSDKDDGTSAGCCACLCVILLIAACLAGACFFYSKETISIHSKSSNFGNNCADSITAGQMRYVKSGGGNTLMYTLISLGLAILGMFLLCGACCCMKVGGKKETYNVLRDRGGGHHEMHDYSGNHYGGGSHYGGSNNYGGGSHYGGNDPYGGGGIYGGSHYSGGGYGNGGKRGKKGRKGRKKNKGKRGKFGSYSSSSSSSSDDERRHNHGGMGGMGALGGLGALGGMGALGGIFNGNGQGHNNHGSNGTPFFAEDNNNGFSNQNDINNDFNAVAGGGGMGGALGGLGDMLGGNNNNNNNQGDGGFVDFFGGGGGNGGGNNINDINNDFNANFGGGDGGGFADFGNNDGGGGGFFDGGGI